MWITPEAWCERCLHLEGIYSLLFVQSRWMAKDMSVRGRIETMESERNEGQEDQNIYDVKPKTDDKARSGKT